MVIISTKIKHGDQNKYSSPVQKVNPIIDTSFSFLSLSAAASIFVKFVSKFK